MKDFDSNTMTGEDAIYHTYGSSCSEVEIDVLTGEYKVLLFNPLMLAAAKSSLTISVKSFKQKEIWKKI